MADNKDKECQGLCAAHPDIRDGQTILFADLKKMVSFKVFAIAITLIVSAMGTTVTLQYSQSEGVKSELLEALNRNQTDLSGRINNIESSISSLAESTSDLGSKLNGYAELTKKLDKITEQQHERLLWLERNVNGHVKHPVIK